MDENEPDCDRCNDTGRVYYLFRKGWWFWSYWKQDEETSPCPDCNNE